MPSWQSSSFHRSTPSPVFGPAYGERAPPDIQAARSARNGVVLSRVSLFKLLRQALEQAGQGRPLPAGKDRKQRLMPALRLVGKFFLQAAAGGGQEDAAGAAVVVGGLAADQAALLQKPHHGRDRVGVGKTACHQLA